jgi:hypothetical protein
MDLYSEQTLIAVWRQVLIENANTVELGAERFPVQLTTKRRLRQVDFVFEGTKFEGLNRTPIQNLNGRNWRGEPTVAEKQRWWWIAAIPRNFSRWPWKPSSLSH